MVNRANVPLTFLLLLVTASDTSLLAQTVVDISPEPTCTECRIELRRIATLGEDSGEGFVGLSHMVVTDGNRVFVVHHDAEDEIRVFDIDGSFIRVLGGAGDGPGEFRRISGLALGPGDSLFAFDGRAARLSVFGPQLEVVRTNRFPVSIQENAAFVRTDGVAILNGWSPVTKVEGAVLHLLDSEGGITASIHGPDPGSEAASHEPTRSMASGSNGGFWIAHYDQYRLEERGPLGAIRRALQGNPSWLQPREPLSSEEVHSGKYPLPAGKILDVSSDAEGLVWIVGETPDAQWRSAVGPDGRPVDIKGYVDSVIEVIDPDMGALLARRVVDGMVRGFASPGLAFTFRETESGLPRIDLIEVHLERR